MNHRSLQQNPRLRELLAAEYVLGTLKGRARHRFEQWLKVDAQLAQAVDGWNGRLQPMAELAAALPPPARVWDGIERRIGLRAAARPSLSSRLYESLGFWRGLGLAASAAALVLAGVMVTRAPAPLAPSYVATLSGDNAQLALAVSGDAARGTLTVRPVAVADIGADKSLELWAVPKQGAPLSLGLVSARAAVTLALPPDVTPQSMPLLAVTLEKKGGSGNPHAPGGPIVYKGAWASL
jgi:anti-sigma-K factor RskA